MSDETRTVKTAQEKKTKSSATTAKNTTARKTRQKAVRNNISIDSAASFYSDIRPIDLATELLYAYIITSPYDRGKLESVEIADLPADYFLLTAEKLPYATSVRTLTTDIPLLARDFISYKGEPVAVLAGSDKKLVEQLAATAVIKIAQESQPVTEDTAETAQNMEKTTGNAVTGISSSEENSAETQLPDITAASAENITETDVSTASEEKTQEKMAQSEETENSSEKKESLIGDIKELITSLEDNIKNTVFNENIQKTQGENETELVRKNQEQKKNDDQIFAERKFSFGDFETNYEKADFQVENTFFPQLHIRTVSEPEGAYVEYENGVLSIYTPTLWASHLRKNASLILNIQEENIRIRRTIVPNSDDNSLWYNTILTCLASTVSVLTQKTVLLVAPQELTEYIDKPVSISIHHKSGVQKDGRIIASILDVTVDAGAYCPFAEQIADSLAVTAAGAYTPDSFHICVTVKKTNRFPAITGTRDIDKLTFFAVESQMQDIAHKTGMNPIELRILNAAEKPEQNENEEKNPIIIDRSKLPVLFDKLLKMSDFNRKYASYSQNPFTENSSSSTFPSRGMGLAAAFDGKGYYGSSMGFLKHTLEVTMEKDSSLTIKSPTPVASIIPVWKQYASEMLNISSDQVHFEDDEDKTDTSELPETITGSVYIMTQLLKKCCQGIQKLRFRQPLPITVKKKLTKPKNQTWNQEKFCGTPYYSISWGVAAAEVEIDPLLYKPKLRGIWISLNAGAILNKKQSEISIRKDISDVLRHIMDGMRLSPDKIYINFVESQDEPKQLGCIIHSILPAAITNAIAHATRNTVHTTPIPIDYIFRGISGK